MRVSIKALKEAFTCACVPGQPLPLEMTLAQLLTLLYERKLPQGYQSISLAVKLGSRVISDSGLSKTDSFKRLRTEKGTKENHRSLPFTEAGGKSSEAPAVLARIQRPSQLSFTP